LKKRPIVLQLFQLSSALQILCYFWLVLPPTWTHTPIPAIVSFATGIGFSPLLLVVIVPQLVPLKYVSTTLGAHKSLEQTGSVIMQTLAGLALDTKSAGWSGNGDDPSQHGLAAVQYLLNTFLVLNVSQLLALLALARLNWRRKAAATSDSRIHTSSGETMHDEFDETQSGLSERAHYPEDNEGAENSIRLPLSARERLVPSATSPEQSFPMIVSETERPYFFGDPADTDPNQTQIPRRPPEAKQVRRGVLFAGLSATLIVFAWVLFLATAWVRLRSKSEREGTAAGIIGH